MKRSPVVITFLAIGFAAAVDFKYTNQDDWSQAHQQCSGRAQSPIDIETKKTKLDPSLQLSMTGYNLPIGGEKFTLKNNGHTVQLTLKAEGLRDEQVPRITGSALGNDTYQFRQLHFHWHSNKSSGSEHAIDGKRYDLEMHYVHVNTKYPDDGRAQNEKDGLVVLGTLFQVVRKDNRYLEPLIGGLQKVKEPHAEISFEHPIVLDELLPDNIDHFFKYSGSLTTPPCSESVTWILFTEVTGIGKKQIPAFIELQTNSPHDHEQLEPLTSNVRDLQKRQKREIFLSGFSLGLKPSFMFTLALVALTCLNGIWN